MHGMNNTKETQTLSPCKIRKVSNNNKPSGQLQAAITPANSMQLPSPELRTSNNIRIISEVVLRLITTFILTS
jgi:hypothetical protein